MLLSRLARSESWQLNPAQSSSRDTLFMRLRNLHLHLHLLILCSLSLPVIRSQSHCRLRLLLRIRRLFQSFESKKTIVSCLIRFTLDRYSQEHHSLSFMSASLLVRKHTMFALEPFCAFDAVELS